MATQREKVGVEMLIQPRLDPKAASEAMRDAKALQQKLKSMKVDWRDLSRHSASNLRNIRDLSSSAADFAKELSSAARVSFKELAQLGRELESARKKAEDLKKKYAAAKTPTEKKAVAGELEETNKQLLELNKQVLDHRKVNQQYGSELKQVIRAQRQYQDALKKAATYTGKHFTSAMGGALRRASTGGIRGAIGGSMQAVSAGQKYSRGVMARTALSGGGGMATAIAGLSKAVPILAGAVTALTGFWQLIKAASEHQTKLNKALLEGSGTAKDFTTSSDEYRQVVNDIRVAAQDSAGSMLKLGANSEKALGIVNRYAQESTGSLMKTRDTLAELGEGDVQTGLALLAKNAIAYGKALGMEAEDVGTLMGQLQTDVGYGAGQIQGVMSNVVKSAATANMPMTKFMSIFRTVLPDVELYQNRLEELTGTIKLLSKTMSAKDVKQFMDAFAQGFKGMDFKQRLKVALVAGTGFVSKTLSKDFNLKAKSMAQNFQKFAAPGENVAADFEKAFKGGEKSMSQFVAKMQGRAAEQGQEIPGAVISNAMKLASYEAARQKGGPSNTATAMRGGGQFATYKILEKFSQTFTKGFDGLSEHVIKQLGVSEEQYDALRTMSQSMKVYRSQLTMLGKTGSKSTNDAMRKLIAETKYNGDVSQVKTEDMINASDEIIFAASEKSNEDKKTAQTAEDLATEQVSATLSISEKIDNVIAFILEKIYKILDPLLALLDKIWNFISGNKSQQDSLKTVDNWNKSIQASGYSPEAKAQMDMFSANLEKGLSAGLGGGDLAKHASKGMDMSEGGAFAKYVESGKFQKRVDDMLARGVKSGEFGAKEYVQAKDAFAAAKTPEEKMKALSTLPGDLAKNLMEVSQDTLEFGVSDAAKKKVADSDAMRRGGTSAEQVYSYKEQRQSAMKAKKEASDLEDQMTPLKDLAGAKKSGVRLGATQVEHIRPAGKPGPAAPPDRKAVTEKAAAQQSQEQAATIVSSQEDAAQDQVKATEDVYKGVTDTVALLKKGIRYETGFLMGPWTNALKTATLDSFRDALIEYAVIQAKMSSSTGFTKLLADYGQEVAGYKPGVAMRALQEIGSDVTDPNAARTTFLDKAKQYEGSMQVGGPVHDTGMYKLHRGEYVVPSMPAGGGSGGQGVVNASIVINGTSMTPKQLENSVYGAIDRLARRP